MRKKTDTEFLKRAKRAVWRNFWLHSIIPQEFHEAMVRLECCSKSYLRSYIKNYSLSPDAEALMVERYAKSTPQLIAFYVQNQPISAKMEVQIILSKDITLLKHIARATAGFLNHLCFSVEAQIALVRLDDPAYFREFYKIFPEWREEIITEIIKQKNVKMFEALSISVFAKPVFLSASQQKMLFEQNTPAMIDLYINRWGTFDNDTLCDIIAKEDYALAAILTEKLKLPNSVEVFLASKGSKKMIAQYLKQWPLCPLAQIELVKREYKDLLKLHFLKHSISEQALLYQLSLNSFKSYIGI